MLPCFQVIQPISLPPLQSITGTKHTFNKGRPIKGEANKSWFHLFIFLE